LFGQFTQRPSCGNVVGGQFSTHENVSCLSKNLFLAVQTHPNGYFSVSFGHDLIISLLYFGASYLLMHVHTLLVRSIGVNYSQTNLHAPERPFI